MQKVNFKYFAPDILFGGILYELCAILKSNPKNLHINYVSDCRQNEKGCLVWFTQSYKTSNKNDENDVF